MPLKTSNCIPNIHTLIRHLYQIFPPLAAQPVRIAKSKQPIQRQHTQPRRQRLPRPYRPRNRAAGQHQGGQKRKLDPIGLTIANAIAAEAVLEGTSVSAMELDNGRRRRERKGWIGAKHTKAPTVTPAAMDGIEPVRTYPVIPPPAVRTARMKAGMSLPWL